MKIVCENEDELADGSGTAKYTWIAQDPLATEHRMNPALVENSDGSYEEGTGAVGGWEKCEMRQYLEDTIWPLIPENVQDGIKTVRKTHYEYTEQGIVTQTTEDRIWIPGDHDGALEEEIIPDIEIVRAWSRESDDVAYFLIFAHGEIPPFYPNPEDDLFVVLCFCT